MATETVLRVDEQEGGLLNWLDGPRLVVGAFAFFLLALSIFAIVLFTEQRKQVDRLDALIIERTKERVAGNQAQVNTCFQRASQGPALQAALRALAIEAETQRARDAISDLRLLSGLGTPTFRECRQLAGRLNVPLPRGIR